MVKKEGIARKKKLVEIKKLPKTKIVEIIKKIPPESPLSELNAKLDDVFFEIYHSVISEKPIIREAIAILKNQPFIVEALIDRYGSVPKTSFDIRFLIIQVLGELKEQKAVDFLKSEVWAPLPPDHEKREIYGNFTDRENEEMIRAKAVHGIGYLKIEDSFKDLIKIMSEHKSISLKINAINTYMWNKGDNKDAAKELYSLLPKEFHPYVDRPRFHHNMDSLKFDYLLLSWMRRWVKNGNLPKNPLYIKKTENKIKK